MTTAHCFVALLAMLVLGVCAVVSTLILRRSRSEA